MYFAADMSVKWLVLLVVLKAMASAISIGSGFRGGLFFASLFLGVLPGQVVRPACWRWLGMSHPISPAVCGLVGMSGMAVAIVGGPLTMGFLAHWRRPATCR